MNAQGGLISFKEVIQLLKKLGKQIQKRWVVVLLIAILGGGLGFLKAYYTATKYVSQITFIVEESKSSGNMLNSIAGQFGLDLGSSSGGGVLNADNIIPFFRSSELCRSVLLSPYDNSGLSIADKYASVYGLEKKWKKQFGAEYLSFNIGLKQNNLTRLQDSLLQIIIKKWIFKNDLYVVRPDKKATFFTLITSMRDEKLSEVFCEKLLQQGVNRYLEIKTKSKLANVQILQRRADSLSSILRQKTVSSASQQQILLDLNPANKVGGVDYEVSAREKNMVSAIFAEVIKNLELSKAMLSQETPTIQIIDKTYPPLERQVSSPLTLFVMGFFISIAIYLFASIVIMIFKRGTF
jgi:hypothetical protein